MHFDEDHDPYSSVAAPIPDPNHAANTVREATPYDAVQQHFRNMLLHRHVVLVAFVINLAEDIAFVRPLDFGIADLAHYLPLETLYGRIDYSSCSPSKRMRLVGNE